jgi:hypothetical protein
MTVHCVDLAKPIIVAAGGACIKNFGLMICGDKIEERAQQQDVRLCEVLPDGTEHCLGVPDYRGMTNGMRNCINYNY